MASEVKTNKISPATSTTINVGDSGDTLALAVDDVTGFNVGSDAAGDVLYNDGTDYTRLAKPGTPADEVLTFATGASAPSWVAAAAGGLTHASQWRLTADFTGDSTISSNLEEVDAPVGFGVLGSSMTESSGIFTFPATGYWLIEFHAYFLANTNSLFNRIKIQTTTDDSAYPDASVTSGAAGAANQEQGIATSYIFDVTDTANRKCRFAVDVNAVGVTTKGDTAKNETFMSFLRLADT
tara:strand:- start:24 stop:740 length:717 start_codon:yes stop_codon:yes gene_type:complete